MPVFEETNYSLRDVWVYFRDIRPHNLTSPKYRHLFWILFWPLYGLAFYAFENLLPLEFHPIYTPLDDYIPFCEIFAIPYYYWFAFLVGALVYTGLFNVPAFNRGMQFIAVTYTVTLIIYLIYPSCQELRPAELPRDNFLTDIVQAMYDFDSNENVCPSIHVLGSVGAGLAILQCKRFSTPAWQVINWFSIVVISFSTVFIKQHSIIDVFAAIILCGLVYPFTFGRKPKEKKETGVCKSTETAKM
ncbi:MAG: phosphatidic acid phosphatase [Clostridia bacterium]|nr:phosphatidic acid phosphatase [Clostridia bacterium]